jgi:transposase
MTVPKAGKNSEMNGRRKRRLTPSEKYEIWLGLLRGEYSSREAADRAGVDRSTILKLREVAKQGALDALAASVPGRRTGRGAGGRDPELVVAEAEIARLTEALAEMGVRLMLAEGKERWG